MFCGLILSLKTYPGLFAPLGNVGGDRLRHPTLLSLAGCMYP